MTQLTGVYFVSKGNGSLPTTRMLIVWMSVRKPFQVLLILKVLSTNIQIKFVISVLLVGSMAIF